MRAARAVPADLNARIVLLRSLPDPILVSVRPRFGYFAYDRLAPPVICAAARKASV